MNVNQFHQDFTEMTCMRSPIRKGLKRLTTDYLSHSSATMPVTLKSLKERAGVNPLISNFLIPVGATINMDGTALYEAVACIFIAQYQNITLNFGQIIIVA